MEKTKKIPIGLVIKQIVEEKKMKVADIAKSMSVERGTIYNTFKKSALLDSELNEWSNLLGLSSQDLLNKQYLDIVQNISTSLNQNPNQYLIDKLNEIEKMFKEQITVKDQQIAGLQRTVDVLLGKSEGVIIRPLYTNEVEELAIA